MPLHIPSDTGPLTYGFDGKLGVGNEKPTEKLDVTGNVKVSGDMDIAGDANVGGDLVLTGSIQAATITTTGTVSPRCIHTGGVTATQASDGNNSTPVVTETYIAECFIPCMMDVTGIAIFNGSAVGTDKLIVFLCDADGNVVANSDLAGTTAVGTDAFQLIPFTAPYQAEGPATHYVALQVNGTTYRFNSHILGSFGASKKTSTVFGTLASITPPTTFTTAVGPIASLY